MPGPATTAQARPPRITLAAARGRLIIGKSPDGTRDPFSLQLTGDVPSGPARTGQAMNAVPSDIAAPPRSPAWKWWVCCLLLLATMLNYMDRLTLNLTARLVMDAFELNEQDYGQLESVFAIAFAVGSITFGWLADRVNVYWLYPAALLVWSAAGFTAGLVDSFEQLLLCRFVLGLFGGSNWP